MKKENVELKSPTSERPVNAKSKPKSLRPMRSMLAVRSLKPRTAVASFAAKVEELEKN